MKTAHDYMSLKKITKATIDEVIANKEDQIRQDLSLVFSDVTTARNVGEDLISLAELKDARLLMSTVTYSVYEKEGKPVHYTEYLQNQD